MQERNSTDICEDDFHLGDVHEFSKSIPKNDHCNPFHELRQVVETGIIETLKKELEETGVRAMSDR